CPKELDGVGPKGNSNVAQSLYQTCLKGNVVAHTGSGFAVLGVFFPGRLPPNHQATHVASRRAPVRGFGRSSRATARAAAFARRVTSPMGMRSPTARGTARVLGALLTGGADRDASSRRGSLGVVVLSYAHAR